MNYRVTVLKGDGIGPEVTDEALKILELAGQKYGFTLECTEALVGGGAIDATGDPLPQETIDRCKAADAVLLGAVGGPKWDHLAGQQRPEKGLLRIRETLGLFANLRPAIVYAPLRSASPLKDEILGDGLDILIVRELTGGIYFGKRGRRGEPGSQEAFDTEAYAEYEIRRVGQAAFEFARKRGKRLCSVDKANVLDTSRLWREIMVDIGKSYPDVELSHMYVDNAAMQLVRHPRQFDTIVTSNMFGDILSDEASQITGSIGMLPSASLAAGTFGLYEPVHGSAPDIAGQNIANPMAAILSAAMMLRYSFGQMAAAAAIEEAVNQVLAAGLRTGDIAYGGEKPIGTKEMGQAIAKAIL
ncbi:MAG: 3-isopropylmalate dehydrogenase [Clostridiales bacterium]